MRTLFVTPSALDAALGGRDLLARLVRDCLTDCVDDLVTVAIPKDRPGRLAALRGYIDGVTPAFLAQLTRRIAADGVGRVVLDGSNLGRAAQAIKRAAPRVTVLTFGHNVEADFFRGAVARDRSVHALGVLAGNYQAERLAVRHSDRLITLSERDSAGLRRRYGRGATDIFPMAMADQLVVLPPDAAQPVPADAPVLFVGGGFYANRQGIAWFAEHVAPHIGVVTNVVGRGMESMRSELERSGHVRVIGGVDDLAEWYAQASVAIAPIFSGSGMKTKVAEALMFGKRIVGSSEAFSGYDDDARASGWLCKTADEFVAAIAAARGTPAPRIDIGRRALYLREYSLDAARLRMARILSSATVAETGAGR